MRIVTTTSGFETSKSPVEIAEMICRAGFEGIDLSFTATTTEQTALEVKQMADSFGVPIVQAHAPIPKVKYREEVELIEATIESIKKTVEISAKIGIETIVIHPVRLCEGDHKEQLDFNLGFYRPIVKLAEEKGINLAIENMCGFKPHKDGYKVKHVCKTAEELSAYVKAFNSPNVVACLDTGHAYISEQSPAEFVRDMGKGGISALHIQDCDGIGDLHTLPYLSDIEWEPFCKALADTEYSGDITLEAVLFTRALPKELLLPGLCLAKETAEHIRNRVKFYSR